MVGVALSPDDAGSTVPVPLGTPVEVHLPAAPEGATWDLVGAPAEVTVADVEVSSGRTVFHLVAMGLGAAPLRFVAGGQAEYAVVVDVTAPLDNE